MVCLDLSSLSTHLIFVGRFFLGRSFVQPLRFASRVAPLHVALLERSLAKNLQLGGVAALRLLGLGGSLDGINAVPHS
jgi:hypothetical protein